MSGLTRRRILAAGGAAAALPVLAETRPLPVTGENPHPVPSGRTDGVRTGGARRVPISGGYQVWVKQIGTGDIPMLTLHGGPGAPHFYLECFEDFVPTDRIRFYYYDQLGCGFSDAPNDPSLWTLDRFVAEVEAVRAALGLERFVLYGQSWGGLLAIEYALKYPQYLNALVISSMTASYLNQQVYVTMQGPSELQVTGNLKDWDRWADLPRIDTPTLLIVGRHDTMSVDDIARMGRLMPNSRVVVCEKGSHMCMYDDQQAYFDALVPFVLARAGKA